MKTEWQYLVQPIDISKGKPEEYHGIARAQNSLNALGAEGWEFFAVIHHTAENQPWPIAFGKRPKA